MGYSFEIVYKPGAQNRVDDALSRVYDVPATYLAITTPQPEFLNKLKQHISTDSKAQQLVQQVSSTLAELPHYKVHDNLLSFHDKLFIPDSSELKTMLLQEFHASELGGHSGITKTYGRLKENVFWVGMK